MIHPHQSVHQRSIDVVNIYGDHAPDHDTPNTTNVNIYNMWCGGSAPGAGWIIYDEAYADQLTKSKLHDISDGCSGMPTTAIVLRMKGLHTQSSWSNRESMRRGGSRSYEVTTLLSISKRKNRPCLQRWGMGGHNNIHQYTFDADTYIHQYTLTKVPYTIGYVEMNKMMLLHWYVWLQVWMKLVCVVKGMMIWVW